MNNAIGLNLPTRSAVESVSVGNVNISHNGTHGENLKQEDDGFLDVLNAELQALSQPESTMNSSDEDIDGSLMLELPTEVDESSFKLLGTEIKIALSQLPKELTELPLTDENKLLIQQYVLQAVEQNNPELMNQLKKQSGQELPLAGSILPVIEELIAENLKTKQAQVLPINSSSTDILKNQLGQKASENNLDLSDLTSEDADADLALKAAFDNAKEDSNLKDITSKKGIEALLAKEQAQADVARSKFTTESVSTPINNILGANQASISTPTTAALQTGSTLLLPQNPSPEQWGSALGDKVQMMINTKLDSAEVRIDPPHLGKMNIAIKMTDDGAQVVIHTQHAATRELVDAASYRLKEMLEDAGHQHVDVDVSHKESEQSEGQMADNDDSQELLNSNANDIVENEIATTGDVIAGTYQTGRPSLDIFA